MPWCNSESLTAVGGSFKIRVLLCCVVLLTLAGMLSLCGFAPGLTGASRAHCRHNSTHGWPLLLQSVIKEGNHCSCLYSPPLSSPGLKVAMSGIKLKLNAPGKKLIIHTKDLKK